MFPVEQKHVCLTCCDWILKGKFHAVRFILQSDEVFSDYIHVATISVYQ
jgi:hypothetical protein